MKKYVVLSLLTFLLASCGQVSNSIRNTTERRQSSPQPTQVYSTSTPYPTATIGWEQTAINAQSTSDAAIRLMVQATSDEANRQQERLLMTATIDLATIQAGQLTAQSDIATSTAALTAVPLTGTAVVQDREIAKTEMSGAQTALLETKNAPTHIIEMAKAESEAKWAETNEKINMGVKVAVSFFVFVLTALMIIVILRREHKPEEEPIHVKPLDDIPFVKDASHPRERYIRASVPCTKEQLIELADGVINRDMTLSFNSWEGTTVHKVLKDMREFMSENHFVKLVKGGDGRLDMLAAGEQFLRDVLDNQEPPAPYRCLPDNA